MVQRTSIKPLRLEKVTVIYKPSFEAVSSVSFEAEAGKVLTLLGASGSGKTTILGAINGNLEKNGILTNGEIFLGEEDITNLPLNRRGIGRVFQKYSLWNHMTVFDNIAFPLRVRGFEKEDIKKKVKSVLSLVKLDKENEIENRRPFQLSGGQQQRVALARAVVFDPKLLLLDEPLSSLDKNLREEMQTEIVELQKAIGITLIYVTHDQAEALSMSDRVVVIDSGKVIQIGSPLEIYSKPKNSIIARFLGDSNFVCGKVVEIKDCCLVVQTSSGIKIMSRCGPRISVGQTVTLMIRPERVAVCRQDEYFENSFLGNISRVTFSGPLIKYEVVVAPDVVISGICLNKNRTLSNLRRLKEIKIGWHDSDVKIVKK